jgi:hypothetical protein
MIRLMEGDTIPVARDEALRRRSEAKDAGWLAPPDSLCEVKVDLIPAPPGWDGTRIDPWRADGATSGRFSLSAAIRGDHPYSEWLSPDVDLSAAIGDEKSWNRFWFHDVQAERMPRCWLRWAAEFLQRFRKVTDGAPCDCQLSTYLIDVDAFASADKALIDIVGRCSKESPGPLANPFRLEGGSACVAGLLRLTKDLRRHVSASAQT